MQNSEFEFKEKKLGENSSYIIDKKRNIFKDRNIEYIPKVKDIDKKKDNDENVLR